MDHKKMVFGLLSLLLLSSFVFGFSISPENPGNNSLVSSQYTLRIVNQTVVLIANISFYYNMTLIGMNSSQNLSSYSYIWDTTSVPDGIYNISYIVSNFSGYLSNSTVSNITVDNTAALWSQNQTNTTLHASSVLFSTYWNDTNGISGCIFCTNNSGSSACDSWQLTTNWFNVSKTLNNTVGQVVAWNSSCNDSAGNWNATTLILLVVSNSQIQILSNQSYPSKVGIGTEVYVSANITDPDGHSDISTVTVRFQAPNGTWTYSENLSSAGLFNSTNYSIVSAGLWNWSINASDGASKDYQTGSFYVYSEINDPIIMLYSHSNNSYANDSTPLFQFGINDQSTINMSSLIINFSSSMYTNSSYPRINCSGSGNNTNCSVVINSTSQGINVLMITVEDMNNNSVTVYYNITVDSIVPNSSISGLSVADSDLDGNIELSWTNDTLESGETYRIYRSNSEINSTNLVNATFLASDIAESQQAWEDNTTIHNTSYWYAILTIDPAGNFNTSALSQSLNATANDTIIPAMITNLSITNTTTGAVFLYWSARTIDQTGNLDQQNVLYSIFKIGGTNLSTLNTSKTTNRIAQTSSPNYTDNSVSDYLVYSYVITVRDDAFHQNTSIGSTNNATINASPCLSSWSDYSAWSDCSSGYQTRSRTRTCRGSIETNRTERTCLTTTYSSGGGSGTGSVVRKHSVSWDSISKGRAILISINKELIPITQFSAIATDYTINAQMTIETVSNPYSTTPIEAVYNYIRIVEHNLEDIDNISIKFRIKKSWMNNNKVAAIQVYYYDETWKELPWSKIGQDATYDYYEMRVQKLVRDYAIGGEQIVTASTISPTTTTITESSSTTVPDSGVLSITTTTIELASEDKTPEEIISNKKTKYTIIIIVLTILIVLLIIRQFKITPATFEKLKQKFTSTKGLDPPKSN